MPFGSIARIRELRLNRRPSRLNCKSLRSSYAAKGVNQVELKHEDGTLHDTQLTVATLNTRSIKNKEPLVIRELNFTNADAIIITETWLNDSEEDRLWLKSSDLNQNPKRCLSIPCKTGKGGGLMLITKPNIEVRELNSGYTKSFEHATWQLMIKNKTITLTGIYHPPPKEGITNSMFIDELTTYISNLRTDNQHNIITGDFNMHIDDPHDNDAVNFCDTMLAFGLIQHVTKPTHHLGNTLDLIFSEMDSAIKVGKVNLGALVSDHHMVYTSLSVKKPAMKRDKATVRKISAIIKEDLCNEYNADIPFDNEDLDTLIDKLDS